MERAVEVMQRSIHESRPDGKVSPRVGAVLWKPDGSVEEAFRGELRDGDHAEYTLLERKNRDRKLDGCKLFATLEPCAKGSRNAPKLSCAERIVLARIKEVWVGVEDPDTKVDRKGIKYLQDNGVSVQMFDPDLQEQIRNVNRKFIKQALERAAAAEEDVVAPADVPLSPLEGTTAASNLADLDDKALDRYWRSTDIDEPRDSDSFRGMLLRQGVLAQSGGLLVPTGFGHLLFGRRPRQLNPQAGLLATIHHAGGEETKDFDGPLVLIPDQIEAWLRDRAPNMIDRSRMRRGAQQGLPFELVREGVVNALVHRDYGILGAKCQLDLREGTITIRSPGRPPKPITIEQLQEFRAPMLSRNPQLHFVFAQMDLAEERGLGMKTFRSAPPELPKPMYRFDDPYLVLTLFRNAASATAALPVGVIDALNADERRGWAYLSSRNRASRTEYSRELGFDDRKAQRHLKKFGQLGLLKREGAGPTTQYRVVRG
jgi:ATP-dependent DNA helicase RecG